MKMICFIFVFVVLLSFCSVEAKHEEYDGYILYEVNVKNQMEAQLFMAVVDKFNRNLFNPSLQGRLIQILVVKEQKEAFQEAMIDAGLDFIVTAGNVKEVLDFEDRLLAEAQKKSYNETKIATIAFDRIYNYQEVDALLESLAVEHPDVVTLVLGGHSFEGRPIKYLRISTSNFQDQSKPVIFVESLIHAREWITLPASLYAIDRLIINTEDPRLLQDYDWIILPIVNPDGYVYSHEHDRFWRKNRASGYTREDTCVGVDLNRNCDFFWSAQSSNDVCSDNFHGRSPFSEPETATIRDILSSEDRITLFIDLHSYGSMILYGYGNGNPPSNGDFLHLIGAEMASAMNSAKMPWTPQFLTGNIAKLLYKASGSTQDYASVTGVPLSYTFELTSFRFGSGEGLGFLVDPEFIEQAGYEAWEGIKAGARYAKLHYRISNGFEKLSYEEDSFGEQSYTNIK